MDVSLGALRSRLLEFRSWDSSGETFNKRVRESLNMALDRMAGDVPEALVPSEEHVSLLIDVVGSSTDVTTTTTARLSAADTHFSLSASVSSDTLVLEFTDSAGDAFPASPLWTPTIDGTWDGIMHLEIKDPDGKWHRRQSREWWREAGEGGTPSFYRYFVSIDRPWKNVTDTLMDFRIHQPEFFVRDDIMRMLEPARIWDETRQQMWAIDTGGAYRQDMIDFRGEVKGRPFRMWRGRHFQLPPPRLAPQFINQRSVKTAKSSTTGWVGPVQEGAFRFCYTYVWGRRGQEWQVAPGGVQDPVWESAPSPISDTYYHKDNKEQSIQIQAANIDAMTNFDVENTARETRSGLRIRFYVARDGVRKNGVGAYNNVETAGIFYLLAEVDPATLIETASYTWDGSAIPDYYRPLKHSTGYYAYKVYPHQDAAYELDMRVLRLPRKFSDDQDTAPIQRDAVPALIELGLYYLCLNDGADQTGAQLHLDRYQILARRYRHRYANPGRVVEPVSLAGQRVRRRYGTFSSE